MSRGGAKSASLAVDASAGAGSMLPKEGADGKPVSPSLLRHLFESGDILESFEPSTPLAVSYGAHAADFGTQFELREVTKAPAISFTGKPGQHYTVLMIDPDAPGPKEPLMRNWLHWIVSDVPSNGDISAGKVVTAYAPPTPPKGNHRYVFVLLEQPKGSKMGTLDNPAAGGGSTGRGKFDAIAFIRAHSLTPVGLNFFCVHANEFSKSKK